MILNNKYENIGGTVFISSMTFGSDVSQIARLFEDTKMPIEFSSGMPYHKDNIAAFLSYASKKLVHNYFPAPEVPFVLNLASKDETTRINSIKHCTSAIEISAKGGASFYCAHAGFLIDPNVEELGAKIEIDPDIEISDQKKLFLDSIEQILKVADQFDIDFYIENNVLAPFNYKSPAQEIPFFCCESKDICSLFQEVNHPKFGLLLDTAHLKVSCKTLDLDLESEFHKIKPLIKAIHHSDNNGFIDSNEKLTTNYWFLKHLPQFKHIDHVVEVKNLTIEEINSQIDLIKNHFL